MDCFRFQIRSEFFDSEPKKFNFDMIEELNPGIYLPNRQS